jgi:hypothetical protein
MEYAMSKLFISIRVIHSGSFSHAMRYKFPLPDISIGLNESTIMQRPYLKQTIFSAA